MSGELAAAAAKEILHAASALYRDERTLTLADIESILCPLAERLAAFEATVEVPLDHGLHCDIYSVDEDHCSGDCTCGLEWRIKVRTEQEMHRAWRKRAEEAESRLAAVERGPRPECYACQRCGRRDGLDAVIDNTSWARITGGVLHPSGEVSYGKWSILCLWCIDELAADLGIETGVSLHFAGRSLWGARLANPAVEAVQQMLTRRVVEAESQLTAAQAERDKLRLQQKIGACDVCWTSSWVPVEAGDPDAVLLSDGTHARCDMCWVTKQLTAAQARIKELESQAERRHEDKAQETQG